LYDHSFTILRYNGYIRPTVRLNRGIGQEDLLSAPLFLSVMNWALDAMDDTLGIRIENKQVKSHGLCRQNYYIAIYPDWTSEITE